MYPLRGRAAASSRVLDQRHYGREAEKGIAKFWEIHFGASKGRMCVPQEVLAMSACSHTHIRYISA